MMMPGFDIAFGQMKFTSATCLFASEQILLPVCTSPQVYTSARTAPRAPLKGRRVSFTRRWGKEEAWKLLEGKGPDWWQASVRGEVGGNQPRSACHLPSFCGSAASAEARSAQPGSGDHASDDQRALPMVSLTDCPCHPLTV